MLVAIRRAYDAGRALVRAMNTFHKANATRFKPWLCVTTVPLFAFSGVSLDAQQPPWEGCRAASKIEYESAKREFFAANQCRRVCNDWALVAPLLLVLPIVATRRPTMRLTRSLTPKASRSGSLMEPPPVYGWFTGAFDVCVV